MWMGASEREPWAETRPRIIYWLVDHCMATVTKESSVSHFTSKVNRKETKIQSINHQYDLVSYNVWFK